MGDQVQGALPSARRHPAVPMRGRTKKEGRKRAPSQDQEEGFFVRRVRMSSRLPEEDDLWEAVRYAEKVERIRKQQVASRDQKEGSLVRRDRVSSRLPGEDNLWLAGHTLTD